MLPPAIRQKEVGMGEQGRLFERHPLPWVVRLWSTIAPDARREVVTLLAEMARRSLSARGPDGAEESDDES
jgi:TorA maturation chaperone TorD